MYNRNTPFLEVHNYFVSRGACDEAKLDYFEPILADEPDISFGEMMDKFLAAPEADEGWAMWGYKQIWNNSSSEIRENLLDKIKDPMRALVAYINPGFDLSKKEKTILWETFEGKLPNAEQGLDPP